MGLPEPSEEPSQASPPPADTVSEAEVVGPSPEPSSEPPPAPLPVESQVEPQQEEELHVIEPESPADPPPITPPSLPSVTPPALPPIGYSPAPSAPLNPRQQKLLSHLKKKGRITRKEYVDLTRASVPTAARDLKELVDAGLIKGIGPLAKGRYYVLA